RATSSPFPSFIDPAPTDLYTLSLHDALPILFEYATLHLHDTFGRAAECVREALQLGIRSFDGAVSGIGGCPYASKDGKRAPGNIDRKSTRLNSSHVKNSYAVFCLKKKNQIYT